MRAQTITGTIRRFDTIRFTPIKARMEIDQQAAPFKSRVNSPGAGEPCSVMAFGVQRHPGMLRVGWLALIFVLFVIVIVIVIVIPPVGESSR